jgi:hypothetical protein
MIRLTAILAVALPLVIACGDDDGGGGGADAGDQADSGPAPDAAPTSTSCGLELTFPEASQRAGAPVVFSTPDGVVLGTEVTDVDGLASRDDCVAGTLLTFDLAATDVGGPGGFRNYQLVTVAGVSPGDTVVFPTRQPEPFTATVPVNISADTGGIPFTSTQTRAGTFGCGSSTAAPGSVVDLSVSQACLGTDSTVDVLSVLQDGTEVTGVSFAAGVAVADGETAPNVVLPAYTNVSADADLAITIANAPAGAASGFASARQGRDQVALLEPTSEFDLVAGAASVAVDLLPTSVIDFADVLVGFAVEEPSGLTLTFSATRGAPATTASVDGSSFLPIIRSAGVSFDDGDATISWLADGSFEGADSGFAVFAFNGPQAQGAWLVVFPAASGDSFTLTSLPKAVDLGPVDATMQIIQFADDDRLDYQGTINAGLDFTFATVSDPPGVTPFERTQRRSLRLLIGG